MNKKIYSFKIGTTGVRCIGRICAEDMGDATNQVAKIIDDFGYDKANVQLTELKNQKLAMKQWQEKHSN